MENVITEDDGVEEKLRTTEAELLSAERRATQAESKAVELSNRGNI